MLIQRTTTQSPQTQCLRAFGGEGGIRTLAPVIPVYSLSRGAPSAILGYFSIYCVVAEREGFEPPAPFSVTGFQDQLHKPLGHLSMEKHLPNRQYIRGMKYCQYPIFLVAGPPHLLKSQRERKGRHYPNRRFFA